MDSQLVVSRPLFKLTEQQLVLLRQRRSECSSDPIANEYDAFMLYPGMGPAIYITADGRIIWYDYGEWGVGDSLTLKDAIFGVVAGIPETRIESLREVLPRRPNDSTTCKLCDGSGRMQVPMLTKSFICSDCGGLGWQSNSMPLDEVIVNRVVPAPV
ncbi:hypothetical protein GC176_20300 [bacterium]|nr:hypothetical protein [bacterium]